MAWSIVAPEFIIMWAMRQWRGARMIAKRYKDRGWTTTHGHYLQMGGFILHDAKTNQPSHVLSYKEFDQLLGEGRINMPEISESDIQDRSKADGLSKAFVLIQTTWFIVQCITRRAQGLATTEFELITVSFAALNGVMYYLWWHKPLDVQSTVAVYLLDRPKLERAHTLPESTFKERDVRLSLPAEDAKETPGAPEDVQADLTSQRPNIASRIKYFLLFLLFRGPVLLISSIYRRLREMSIYAEEPCITTETHLPAFYAIPDISEAQSGWPEANMVAAAAAFGVLFGGIHCIGWSFIFPSLSEQKLWRVCSALITAIPVVVLLMHPLMVVLDYMQETLGVEEDSKIYEAVVLVFGVPVLLLLLPLPPAYVIARLALLVEATISLRDIPPEAYMQVDWTSFLPHV
ncbi:hypothetical protein D9613_012277 [Agrocybe pediades]|uniref:Uncharacterized protein n=1 Tax=Agrocybe pediades TaxID=84607 RepID=A0A8H4VHC5_9AGAR|nr:hypothetical protein D9613_012277 [Agrocybe pediades]